MDFDLSDLMTQLLMTACGFWAIVVVVLMVVFALSRFLGQTWGLFSGRDDDDA